MSDRMVWVYSKGVVHCSVCIPMDMPMEEVVAKVNRLHPTGIDSQWELSTDLKFATGEPNPCECPDEKGRIHRLMVC